MGGGEEASPPDWVLRTGASGISRGRFLCAMVTGRRKGGAVDADLVPGTLSTNLSELLKGRVLC